jgi:hypothetical protein
MRKPCRGLGLTKADAHGQLLEQYRAKTQGGLWHTLSEDRYIHAHLTWHMEQAGQPEAIHGLLRETRADGRNGWYEACDAIGQPAQFVSDLGRAWRLAEELYEQNPTDSIVLQCRYGLVKTTISSISKNIPAELVAKFVEHSLWSVAKGISYIKHMQPSQEKARAIIAIEPFIPSTLIPQLAEEAFVLEEVEDWANAMLTLSEKTPYLYEKALDRCTLLEDKTKQVIVLGTLAKKRPLLFQDALMLASEIQDQGHCSSTLRKLAESLPENFCLLKSFYLDFLSLILSMTEESHVLQSLGAFVKVAPVFLHSRILEEILSFEKTSVRDNAIRILSTYFSEISGEKLVEAIRSIQGEECKASAFINILDRYPHLATEAFESIRVIDNDFHKSNSLSRIVEYLPDYLIEAALNISSGIRSQNNRAAFLCKLACCREEYLSIALEAIESLKSMQSRTNLLTSLSKKYPALLNDAFYSADSIEDVDMRLFSLLNFSEHYPDIFPRCIQDVRENCSERNQTTLLRQLSQDMPTSLLEKLLKEVELIQDKPFIVICLRDLSETSFSYLDEAYLEATSIQKLYHRAICLISLADLDKERFYEDALNAVRLIPNAHEKVFAFCQLARTCEGVYDEILQNAELISEWNSHLNFISYLPEGLPEYFYSKTLDLINDMQEDGAKAEVLKVASYKIPDSLVPRALNMAYSLSDESFQINVLEVLFQRLPTSFCEDALQYIFSKGDNEQALLLSSLAMEYPEHTGHALASIHSIENQYSRALLLIKMAKRESELFEYILCSIENIDSEPSKKLALKDLIENLPHHLCPRFLQIVDGLKAEASKSEILRFSVQYLPEELLLEVKECARTFKNSVDRAAVLSALLPRLVLDKIDLSFWQELLATLTCRTRAEFLEDIPKLAPAIISLGGQAALNGVVAAIQQVCGWWP